MTPPKTVATIFGTRPEAIKMAPVVRALREAGDFKTLFCSTGQHQDLLAPVLEFFAVRPDHNLAVMRPNQTLSGLTSTILNGMTAWLQETRPDMVLVHGDTTSAFAGALAAYYLRIPVGHIEAGLRSGDLDNPFPEEMNRRFIDSVSTLMFAPTQRSAQALLDEQAIPKRVIVTGNTVIDALHFAVKKLDADPTLSDQMDRAFSYLTPGKQLILATGHRRENFGNGMLELCRGLRGLAERGDVEIVYPVHPNPNVRNPVRQALGDCPGIHLIDPVDYLSMIYLLRRCHIVITDSGGLQEEAPAFGKPVFVTRLCTERPEAIDAGAARLVGTDGDKILREISQLIDEPRLYLQMSRVVSPYGDGHASERIISSMREYFHV